MQIALCDAGFQSWSEDTCTGPDALVNTTRGESAVQEPRQQARDFVKLSEGAGHIFEYPVVSKGKRAPFGGPLSCETTPRPPELCLGQGPT